MPKITIREIEAAYEKGVAVHLGRTRFADAVASLRNEHSMNSASASDYVLNVGNILSGKVYRRTFNLTAADYFLNRISQDFPPSVLGSAISAIKLHIGYYQTVSGTKLTQLAAICDKYLAAVKSAPVELTKIAHEFDAETERARSMSSQERLRKAGAYPAKPNSTLVLASAFIRNPYVKAEVLIRSMGICEMCKMDGPFKKKKDGEPYLEVHHKFPLAEGGDDTVANAIALCPNCHREAHLGENWERFRS
jgi:5-methylcytosine-specific restriction enzyme A